MSSRISDYLADKSALARLAQPAVRRVLAPLIDRGLVATCWVTRLEVGHSARSLIDYDAVMATHDGLYDHVPIPEGAWRRAADVQRVLASRGQHRGVGIPDLLIAATAEAEHLTVLHYDHDFDLIAGVTGQHVQWVAPAGTAH